jgi:hypothetical protein
MRRGGGVVVVHFTFTVTPAKAGVQGKRSVSKPWTPAFAGVTAEGGRASAT